MRTDGAPSEGEVELVRGDAAVARVALVAPAAAAGSWGSASARLPAVRAGDRVVLRATRGARVDHHVWLIADGAAEASATGRRSP